MTTHNFMKNPTHSTLGIMIAMSLAVLMINIEVTAIYVILHPLSQDLHLTITESPWVITLYLLFFTSVIVLGGRLGDLYGHRNVFLFGLLLFASASLLGGLTHEGVVLFVARALQGLSAGLIWPNSTAVAFDALPEEKKGFGIGIISE